jgi:hypothetical protein
MKIFGGIVAGLLGLVLIGGLMFGGKLLSIELYRYFGTKIESANTDIYRENKSYVEGTVRDLREMQVEYYKADDKHKSALKSLILHRSNELDWDRLPSDVSEFLYELKGE